MERRRWKRCFPPSSSLIRLLVVAAACISHRHGVSSFNIYQPPTAAPPAHHCLRREDGGVTATCRKFHHRWGNRARFPSGGGGGSKDEFRMGGERRTGGGRGRDGRSSRVVLNLFGSKSDKIPKEIMEEIYTAEANTPSAQNRQVRVASYGFVAFLGLLMSVGAGVLRVMAENGEDMSPYMWTKYVPTLTGDFAVVLDIVLVGLFGTLIELEFNTRNDTAEKIYGELEKRRTKSELQVAAGRMKKSNKPISTSRGGRKKNKKQRKRLEALAEVVDMKKKGPSSSSSAATEEGGGGRADTKVPQEKELAETGADLEGGGVVGTVKRFWDQADTIAASQALLLNKKLEEEGVLEKITDESGLLVVGREAAAKLEAEKKGDAEEKKKGD